MIEHTEIVKNYKGLYECEIYKDGKYICKVEKSTKRSMKDCIKNKEWKA